MTNCPKLRRTEDGCWIARIADDIPETAKYGSREGALKALCEIMHGKLERLRPNMRPGCGKSIVDEWWHFCGETDMGGPAVFCTGCGGDFERK